MPDWSEEIRDRLEGLNLEPAREAEIVEELGQHVKEHYEELLAAGTTADEARRGALDGIEDGRLAAALESGPKGRRPSPPPGQPQVSVLAGIAKDLRYGLRVLALHPGFTSVAILSLALGIGANTAIFQLLDAVRLRSLPVEDPSRLAEVRIGENSYGRTGDFAGRNPQLTVGIWRQLASRQRAFSSLAAWSSAELNLSSGGEVRNADGLWVSGAFFETLGVRPSVGRLIGPSDDNVGCGSAGVVLSDAFWHREFGGAAEVIGRKITLESHPFEIIGVTPASFFGIEVGRRFDVALPLCAEPVIHPEKPRTSNAQAWWLASIGRLKPGCSFREASTQLAWISPSLFESTLPAQYDAVDAKNYRSFRLEALPASSGVSSLRRRYETPLWLLLATSGLVLLIACANLANLIMARASARRRELAVRMALGASRGVLLRQLICENLLLAGVGTACGVGLAQILSRALLSFLDTQGERWSLDLAIDARVLLFATALAALTCLVFGLAPALQAAKASPGEAMKTGGRASTAGRQGMSARRMLVIAQVALSLVLLVGALLFVRTLRNLIHVNAGFRRGHILVADIDASRIGIPPTGRLAYRRDLLARLEAIPGVAFAAGAKIVPVSGDGWNENVSIPGSTVRRKIANFNRVGAGYFRTVGTALLSGRDFGSADTVGSVPVAIVTETFARKFLGGANPVGRALAVAQQGGKPDEIYQIVGLAKDTKYSELREEFTPIVFTAEGQDPDPDAQWTVFLRSDRPLAAITASVKHVVGEASPAIGLRFRIFETMIRSGLLRERLMATLSGFFGLLAAILAMIGLYGVISYTVERRRNEIGVRMALGATRGDVLSLILKEAAALLGAGLAIGIGLSTIAGLAARSLLFELRPGDPLSMAIAVLGLAAVAVAASLLPARRAASLDPMVALRDE